MVQLLLIIFLDNFVTLTSRLADCLGPTNIPRGKGLPHLLDSFDLPKPSLGLVGVDNRQTYFVDQMFVDVVADCFYADRFCSEFVV